MAGGDLGNARADDPAADHEQVEPLRPQALERESAVNGHAVTLIART